MLGHIYSVVYLMSGSTAYINNYLLVITHCNIRCGSYYSASKLQSLSRVGKAIACYSTKEALIGTVLWDISKL